MRMLAMAALALLGCKSHDEEATSVRASEPVAKPVAKPVTGKPALRGGIRRDPMAYFGVIVPAGTKPEPCEAAAIAAGKKRGFAIATKDSTAKAKFLTLDRTTPDEIGWNRDPKLIDDDLVPAADRKTFDKATLVIGIVGNNEGQDPKLVLQTAEVARAVAEACRGWIVDLDLNRVLPFEQLATYIPDAKFDPRKMIMLHQVAGENELGYIDSDGLARLGLPEIYVAEVPAGYARSVGRMLNATAQTLVERGDLTRDGELDVDLSKLSGDWDLEGIKKAGGTGMIHWKVRWSRPEDMGNGTPMLELFIAGAEPGSAVALLKAIETYEGAEEDKVHNFDFQPELDAAAVKARAALGALRPHFAKGIPYDERLSIKAPFKADQGGNEWMWVDVFTFKGGILEGTLGNTPNDVSALQLGARVKVKFSDVADFIHRRGDKTNVGGFSLEVMRKHGVDVPPLSEM